MLVVENIARAPLSPVSLEIPDGTCIAVSGKSGSGKSLLLRAIADLDPASGTVTLDGRNRNAMPATEWRRNVTYVAPQSGWWFDRVGDHFEAPDIAATYLARVGLDAHAVDWPVSRLSTGEQQRLAIVRAMVQSPRVLLLDEPTSALDPEATAEVEGLMHEKIAAGTSIILVSHDPRQAARMAPGGQYVMEKGVLSEKAGAA